MFVQVKNSDSENAAKEGKSEVLNDPKITSKEQKQWQKTEPEKTTSETLDQDETKAVSAQDVNSDKMAEGISTKKLETRKSLREKSSSPLRSAVKGVANALGLRTPSRKRT